MNIYLDIETIPCQKQEFIDEKELKIKEGDIKAEEKYRKTALDGSFGEIVCICYAIEDQPIRFSNRYFIEYKSQLRIVGEIAGFTVNEDNISKLEESYISSSEKELISMFFEDISKDIMEFNNRKHTHIMSDSHKFIGHNISFDLRFLYQRSVINGVKPSINLYQDSKPWDGKTVDTMTLWSGYGNKISLHNLCKALGIEGKDDLDGSKVWDYVKEGRIDEVAKYCAKDVERVREVYKRIMFL